MTGLLVVTAVPAEAAAVRSGLVGALPAGATEPPVTVVAAGVGPAVAGAATARLLALAEAAGRPYRAVVSAGIAGGFAGRVAVGGTVLGSRSVAADVGAESPEGFIPVDRLGMPPEQLGGPTAVDSDPGLLAALRAALPGATVGAVLTVSTVTGTAASTAALVERHPDAVAESMEGYGVAIAATHAGLPFVELRTVSNPIGPRDRGAWRMREAFAALTAAAKALGQVATSLRAAPAGAAPPGAGTAPAGAGAAPAGAGTAPAGLEAAGGPGRVTPAASRPAAPGPAASGAVPAVQPRSGTTRA